MTRREAIDRFLDAVEAVAAALPQSEERARQIARAAYADREAVAHVMRCAETAMRTGRVEMDHAAVIAWEV